MSCQTMRAVALAAATVILGSGIAAAQQPIDIVYSTYNNKETANNRANEWLMDELVKRSNGRVRIKDKFYSAALLKGPDALKGIGQGLADAGYVCALFTNAQQPLASMMDVPYMSEKGDAFAAAVTELYETYPPFKAEFDRNNVVMLASEVPSPTILGVNKVINNADDLKGLKVRAVAEVGNILRKGGGLIPTIVEVSEIPTSLQTGLIDGYSGLPLWYPGSAGYIPMTKTLIAPGIGLYAGCSFVMNRDKYNSMPDDVKKIIGDLRHEYLKKNMEFLLEGDKKTIDQAKAAGVKLMRLPASVVEEWKKRVNVADMEAEWIKARQARTRDDVKAFFDKYKELLAKYEKTATYKQEFPDN